MCVTFHFYSFYFIFSFYFILHFWWFLSCISFFSDFILFHFSVRILFYFILFHFSVPGGAARPARGRKRPRAPRPQYIQRHMQGLICVNPKRGRTPQSSSSTRSYESKLGFRVSIVKKIRFRGLYTRGGPRISIPLNPTLLTLVTP